MNQQSESDQITKELGNIHSIIHLFQTANIPLLPVGYGACILIVSSLMAAYAALSTGWLIDAATGVDTNNVYTFVTLLIAAELGVVIFNFFGQSILRTNAIHSICAIRICLFHHLNKLPLRYFDTTPTGRILTRLTNDIERIEEFFGPVFANLLAAILIAAVSAMTMVGTDFHLGGLMVVSMIPTVLVTRIGKRYGQKATSDVLRTGSALNARMNEFLRNFSLIRSSGLEDWSQRTLDRDLTNYLSAWTGYNQVTSWVRPLLDLLSQAPLLIVLLVAGSEVLGGERDVATLVVFIRLADRFARSFRDVAGQIHLIQGGMTSAERIKRFLSEPNELAYFTTLGSKKLAKTPASITFENVSMGYTDSHKILDSISFEITPGQTVGLAGRTGSGKTTLISLLAGLYKYQKGKILFNNEKLEQYNRDSLRHSLGVVTQEPLLFYGSIEDNVTLGEDILRSRLEAIAEKTGLLKAMKDSKLTFSSPVGEFGNYMSVGQRQLIAFTRSLLADPSIIILDEATANVDEAYEKLMHEVISSSQWPATKIVIAHRLSTLKSCERILVLKDGKLIQDGDYSSLASIPGHFQDLIRSGDECLQ